VTLLSAVVALQLSKVSVQGLSPEGRLDDQSTTGWLHMSVIVDGFSCTWDCTGHVNTKRMPGDPYVTSSRDCCRGSSVASLGPARKLDVCTAQIFLSKGLDQSAAFVGYFQVGHWLHKCCLH
jgi:hypothetical protein